MHEGLARGFKPLKTLPEPGKPAQAPRPFSRTRPGTTPMSKDGPLNDANPMSLRDAIEQADVRDPAPKPFIPPQSEWPAEPPVQQVARANQGLMRAYKAINRSK